MFHVFGKFGNGAQFFCRFGKFFVCHFVEVWEVDGKDHGFDFFSIIFEKLFDCGLDSEITLVWLFGVLHDFLGSWLSLQKLGPESFMFYRRILDFFHEAFNFLLKIVIV